MSRGGGRPVAAVVLSAEERAYLERQVRRHRIARALAERCRIDLGVRKRGTLSNGETRQPCKRDAEQQKARQQRIARCQRGSPTRQKAVQHYARFRRKEAVRNRHACHRITTGLMQRFGLIAIKDLNVKHMGRSATGSLEEPSRNVRQQAGLHRSMNEQTWGLFREQVGYKAGWAGRHLVTGNPQSTSHACSRCGQRYDPGRSEVSRCLACGIALDRDVNAAINILRAGNFARAARQKGILCDSSI